MSTAKRTYIHLHPDEHELLEYVAMLSGKCRGEYAKQIIQEKLYHMSQTYGPVADKQQAIILRRIRSIQDGR